MSCGVHAYPVDLAIAVDHMTLKATEEGLGTCWIGAFQQDRVKDILGIAPLPAFEAGESVSTLGGWHIGISKMSDAKPESWELLCFITSFDTQKALAMELGWNSGRKDVYTDAEVLSMAPHLKHLR